MEAANVIHEFADQDEEAGDAYVTLCVHAGIAASDVICCVNLGEHARGESHSDAVELLKRVDQDAAKQLSALLNLKTKSGYSHMPVTAAEFKRAGRAATALVEQARRPLVHQQMIWTTDWLGVRPSSYRDRHDRVSG